MESWLFKGKPFTNAKDFWGYVYVIVNIPKKMFYIGKKQFNFVAYKYIKKKRKRFFKESDWVTYIGSNKTLIQDYTDQQASEFKRYIISICLSKTECTYIESFLILYFNALLNPLFYNELLSCKISKKNSQTIINKKILAIAIKETQKIIKQYS